eukprot:CAMPEP_0201521618 /NCGR_PEP_ID=MMETSP0161_2-20130828/15209_1 /ASSEMBLY_ACC=CAM_ASM_000251 /TAXON_ID=180227 /ORGANISM="Neoparamoeba aestuarina, Strain SoJaBio B1-5/56/2" /LENGTH=192 /DNA_ID=CAMNT_0047920281 /DNA_START=12 /DNA_END=590 /DNA_ORIENTATION=+
MATEYRHPGFEAAPGLHATLKNGKKYIVQDGIPFKVVEKGGNMQGLKCKVCPVMGSLYRWNNPEGLSEYALDDHHQQVLDELLANSGASAEDTSTAGAEGVSDIFGSGSSGGSGGGSGGSKKVDVDKVYGKIQFVKAGADYKVKEVKSYPDLKVSKVSSFADKPGKWKIVDYGADYKIQVVTYGADFTIKYV